MRVMNPQQRATSIELLPGISAVLPGVLWLAQSRAIVAADAHLAYEDVIGAALPTWSTHELAASLLLAAQRMSAREIVFLGDVIHGSRMSEGAAREVRSALEMLRAHAEVTIIAGNHEGRTRGAALLGETFESLVRDGWHLLHGDRAADPSQRSIIGHLHPGLFLDHGAAVPAFLSSERLVVVPALTPYSVGLDVCGSACMRALRAFGARARDEFCVTAVTPEYLYPFGSLEALRSTISMPAGPAPKKYRRKVLRAD